MAYSNNYSNNSQNKYAPSVFSPYRMNNAESQVDPTCMTFSFWNSMLKISICPRKETQDGSIAFDMKGGISIYLNHTKAHILSDEFKHFLEDPMTYNGCGVISKSNLITISDGAEYGADSPMIVIRHLDDEGHPTSSYGYQVRTKFHYSIRNYIGDGDGCVKDPIDYTNLDIQETITLLDQYCNAMTYAHAYAVVDANEFNRAAMSNKIYAIAQKLGVDNGNTNGGNSYSPRSIGGTSSSYSGNSDVAYKAATMDDFE